MAQIPPREGVVPILVVEPEVEFTVYGEAAPKGSKRAFIRRKGGVAVGVGVEESSKKLPAWDAAVREEVQRLASAGQGQFEGPLGIEVWFYRGLPKSAPKTKRILPTTKPDLGKLLRAVEDALVPTLVRDDALFVDEHTYKRYAYDDPRPRAVVRIWRIV